MYACIDICAILLLKYARSKFSVMEVHVTFFSSLPSLFCFLFISSSSFLLLFLLLFLFILLFSLLQSPFIYLFIYLFLLLDKIGICCLSIFFFIFLCVWFFNKKARAVFFPFLPSTLFLVLSIPSLLSLYLNLSHFFSLSSIPSSFHFPSHSLNFPCSTLFATF